MSEGVPIFVLMEYMTWINRLRAWGISSARTESKATLSWFFVWMAVKWLLIIAGIISAYVFAVLFGVLFAVLKGK
jgi:hypothetical protein